MRISILITVAAALMLSACGLPAATASTEREQEARALIEDLAQGRDDALAQKMSSHTPEAELRAQLPFVKSLVPEGPVPEGQTVGWNSNVSTSGSTYALERTYDYPDRTLRVQTTFVKEGQTWKVGGFHVSPIMKPGAAGEPVEVVAPDPPAAP